MRSMHCSVSEMSQKGRIASCYTLVIIMALVIGITLWTAFPQMVYHQRYAVLVDAGSVHTAIYAYEYPSKAPFNKTAGNLEEIFHCEISATQGLSMLKPSQLQGFIFNSSCIKRMYSETEIEPGKALFGIGGTAGMRGLREKDPNKAKEIVETLQGVLDNYALNGSFVKILSSQDEGVYGWLSVNYLMNGLDLSEANQVGSLDWGGGSSEITFASNKTDSTRELNLFNESFNVFTRSDECYGQSEAINRYFVALVQDHLKSNPNTDQPIAAPCQPSSAHFTKTTNQLLASKHCVQLASDSLKDSIKSQDTYHFSGTGNPEECKKIIKQLISKEDCSKIFKNNCFKPLHQDLVRPSKFFAFSTYFYTGSLLNLDSHLKLLEAKSHANKLCLSPYENHPLALKGEDYVLNECFRGLFMTSLIEDGYGFMENDTVIHIVDKIQGQSVGWTLGFALDKAQHWPILGDWVHQNLSCVITPLVLVSIVFFFVLWNSKYFRMFINWCRGRDLYENLPSPGNQNF